MQSKETVLVKFTDGKMLQMSNTRRQRLYEVLTEVQVSEVHQAGQLLGYVLQSVLGHVKAHQVLEFANLGR